MKKTLILSVLLLSSVSFAETYTWVGKGSSTQWNNVDNWVTSSGATPSSMPPYTSQSKDTYIIGNGATVTATDVSVFVGAGSIQVGNNVSMGGNWAFGAKDITIGTGFTWTGSGDGLKFQQQDASGNNLCTDTNTLVINSTYSGGDKIVSTMASGSSINFKNDGKIVANLHTNDMKGKALTLSATVASTSSDVVTRWLIEGTNIYYRDVTSDNKMVDYANSSLITTIENVAMTKYDFVTDTNAAWTLSGSSKEITNGAYRFVATEGNGIGVQFYVTPEPATATLSLLALAGLAARRRRK